jgi:hypothetical protein
MLTNSNYAQKNIIKNGNFEELKYNFLSTIKCVDKEFMTVASWEAIAVTRVEAWQANSNFSLMKVADERDRITFSASSQNRDTNSIMMGIVVGDPSLSIFCREYLVGILQYPLQTNKLYKFSIDIYLPSSFCVGIDSFGFNLSKSKPQINDYSTRYEHTGQILLSQKYDEWQRIEITINAKGDEVYIMLGVFQHHSNLKAANTKKEKKCLSSAQYFVLSNVQLIALDSSEWHLAEEKITTPIIPIVGQVNNTVEQKTYKKKYTFIFTTNSTNIPHTAIEIEKFAEKLRTQNIPYTISISSPQDFSTVPKNIVDKRQEILQDWLDGLGAQEIKMSSSLKILLQQSQQINIELNYVSEKDIIKSN